MIVAPRALSPAASDPSQTDPAPSAVFFFPLVFWVAHGDNDRAEITSGEIIGCWISLGQPRASSEMKSLPLSRFHARVVSQKENADIW